jgi:hypothetical protein
MPDNLERKAQEIEDFVERLLIDSNGVVYSGIHSETLKPWAENDLGPSDDYIPVPGFEAWEILNYENAGMTTGAYLAAQSFRYRVTGDREALTRASRSFGGLCWIYRLGMQKEEGYFPKSYGGRISHEISTDQYLYAIKGMMAYRSIAPSEHVAAIGRMIPKMVDFWVKREYRHDYFAIKDMLWPLGRFPSLLLAAYVVSEEERYRAEARRLNQAHHVYRYPADSQIMVRLEQKSPFNDLEKRLGNRYLGLCIGECAAMDIMELDECLQHSQEYQTQWLASMAMSWREGKLPLVDRGLSRNWVLYDPANGQVSSPDPQFTGGPDTLGWSYMQWICGSLTARSTMLARVGVHVAKWLPDAGAAETVERILSGITLADMRHNIDPDGRQMRPEHRFLCKLVDVDAIANWLWAYWQGRHEGVLRS